MFAEGCGGGLAVLLSSCHATAALKGPWKISPCRAAELLGTQPTGNTRPSPFLMGFNAPLRARGPKYHSLTSTGLADPSLGPQRAELERRDKPALSAAKVRLLQLQQEPLQANRVTSKADASPRAA